MLSREFKDIKTKIKVLEMKTAMYEVKKHIGRLDIADYLPVAAVQDKTNREKSWKK